MASVPVATPVRQPRGPSANAFGSSPSPIRGPPLADSDSLRRANTVSNPRSHQASASISTTLAGSSAFHGYKPNQAAVSRLRSGSLSNSAGPVMGPSNEPRLSRNGSLRAAAAPMEQVVIESGEEGTSDASSQWGKGLVRQSSLPSRQGGSRYAVTRPNDAPNPTPPRPPRRNVASAAKDTSTPSHAASQSMSSLSMIQPEATLLNHDPTLVAGVSRTQSLRNQARHQDGSSLGRSASLRTAAEHHARNVASMSMAFSPPSQPMIPRNPFTPPTPPPVSSTAALPPMQLSVPHTEGSTGADIRRHQSLTQGYGSSNRVRDRLERSPVVMLPDRRAQSTDPDRARDEPPTSPIGRSVWAPGQRGDDGWGRSTQNISDALEAMQLGKRIDSQPRAEPGIQQNEEPSWVANLVGQPDRVPRQPSRSPHWTPVPVWPEHAQPQPYLHHQIQPMGYPGQPSLKPAFQPPQLGYMGGSPAPMYPNPPRSAPPPQTEADVLQLARAKGLNPSSFDCHPLQARFFVIKSYTEDDVQKSLKHGIWSSTVLGNKRLDGAFRESAAMMPIYLFFSVNGSRHFCGVAQMLTAVDESQTSSVWAQDKWKGIFKVKWIFVRDVPTAALRHIRLLNTPEQKPITNSRDTQELHYEAGCEVLEIFLDYQTKSKTSLLQDFAYYEQLTASRDVQLPPMPYTAAPNMSFPVQQMAVPPVPPIPARFR